MIDRRVVRDLEDPGGELELGAVGIDRVERLDEGLLGEILGQLAVAHHAEEQGKDRTLVAPDQLAVGGLLAGAGPQNHLLIAEAGPFRTAARHGRLCLPSGFLRDYIQRLC